jgi:aromatic-L-amino-acid/L-tryptophan decarboxylase
LGRSFLRKVDVGPSGAMVPEALERAITADRDAGYQPSCVVACLGTTGSSGVDPLRPVADICQRYGLWLHVDAAWAGSALILPECRWMIDGVERVDSFVFNPHKWLFTNFDCSALFVRDVEEFVRVFSILPEYLKTKEGERVTNYRDWGIQMGRRFRALKLWFVLREYGAKGLRAKLRAHIEWAQELARDIDATPDFELLSRPAFALLCFRYRPDPGLDDAALDAINERLLHALNDTGDIYVTHTRVNGKYAIRFVVGQTSTERRHVRQAWDLIQERARALAS